jgi:16S rRNA (cytidine1402-2'-O)-methyltransferase
MTKPLAELLDWVTNDSNQQRGECVVLIQGAAKQQESDEAEINRVLTVLLKELPTKRAAVVATSLLSVSKNKAYDMALKLQQK